MFSDGRLWVNVGSGDKSRDYQVGDLNDIANKKPQIINYQPVDFSKYNYEVYFVEKPWTNVPHLFLLIVMERKTSPVFEYIRPYGPYWEALRKNYKGSKDLSKIEKKEKYEIPVEVEIKGKTVERTVYPTPLYGHHHPNRSSFGLNGGACPTRGGDFGPYPWGIAGGKFANNDEEITPYCDGFVLDVKCWTNLFVQSWDDSKLGLGNAGFPNSKTVNYEVDANFYGKFTDPYLIDKGIRNEHRLDLTNGKIIEKAGGAKVTIPIEFATKSYPNNYNEVSGIEYKQTAKLTDLCPGKCESDVDSSFYDFAGASGTQHGRKYDDPNFLKTNSELPLLPRFEGFMGTHG